MKIFVEKSFSRDIDRIKDKRILKNLNKLIIALENAKALDEIPQISKIKGFKNFFRIRIGDYRLGLEEIKGSGFCLIRFLHRKDIYKYFPLK